MRRPFALLLVALAAAGASPAPEAGGVTVSAAVSAKEPLRELSRQLDDGGCDVRFNLGGSAALAAQLLRGAPADLFVSASPREIERLATAGIVPGDAGCSVATNRLAVVAAPGVEPPGGLDDLSAPRFGRISVAHPRTAPLGVYTAQAFEAAGLSRALGGRTVQAFHARQAADYVRRGEVDAGVVYATDAERFGLAVAFFIDARLHEPIAIHAAPVPGGTGEDGCRDAFLRALCSEAGARAFEAHGFRRWSGPR